MAINLLADDNSGVNLLSDEGDGSFYPEQKGIKLGPRLKRAGSILGEDILKIPGAIGGAITKGLNAAPREIGGVINQSVNPATTGRMLKNLLIGSSDVEKSLYNLPISTMEYLGHLGLISPQYLERLSAAKMEHEPVGDYLRGTMGDTQVGDTLLQKTPGAALWANPAARAASVAGKGIKTISKPVMNKITGVSKYKALEEKLALPQMEKSVEAAKALSEQKQLEHEVAQMAHREAKDVSTMETGSSSAPKMEFNVGKQQENLTELKQNIGALKHQMENLPKIKQMPPSDIAHIEHKNQAMESVNRAEQDIEAAKNMHSELMTNIGESEKAIGERLNLGTPHDVNVAQGIQKHVGDIENHWAGRFKDLVGNLENARFEMPNIPKYELDMDKLLATIRGGVDKRKFDLSKVNPKDYGISKELEGIVDLAPTASDVRATDFLSKYQDFRSARHELIADLKNDPSAESRKARLKAYEDSKPIEQKIQQTLEKGLGEHAQEFKDINKGYSTQVFPLRANKHVRQAREQGALPENMIKALRGKAEGQKGVGQELLRNIVKNDPELVRNLLGQRFANNPKELLSPNQLIKEYLDQAPEIKEMLGNHTNLMDTISESKSNIDTATSRHAEASERLKESHEASQKAEKQAKQVEKEHKEAVSERERQRAPLQKEITDHHDKIKKIEKQLPVLEKHITSLKAAAKKENMTLKQKMEAEKKVKQETEKLNEQKKQLKDAKFGYKILTHKLYKLGRAVPLLKKFVK